MGEMTKDTAVHRFLSSLLHLGWGMGSFPVSEPLSAPAGTLAARTRWLSLPLPDEGALVVLSLPQPLHSQEAAFRAYEDLTMQHRALLPAVDGAMIPGRYLLFLSGSSAQLLDREKEEVLVEARTLAEQQEKLFPLLRVDALARGSLASFPRRGVRQLGQELAGWISLWSNRLGSRLGASHGLLWRFADALLLARVAEETGACLDMEHGPLPRTFGPLVERLDCLSRRWNLVDAGSLPTVLALASEAEREGLLAPCLESFSRLSKAKFTSSVLAEAITDEPFRVLSWRQALIAAPLVPEDAPGDDLVVTGLDLDFDQVGTGILLRRFDELTQLVRKAAAYHDHAQACGLRPGLQLDLLGESRPELPPPAAAPHYVLQKMLRAQTRHGDRLWLARTLLLARACEWSGMNPQAALPWPAPHIERLPIPAQELEPAFQLN